jgi:hypothetical protein
VRQVIRTLKIFTSSKLQIIGSSASPPDEYHKFVMLTNVFIIIIMIKKASCSFKDICLVQYLGSTVRRGSGANVGAYLQLSIYSAYSHSRVTINT